MSFQQGLSGLNAAAKNLDVIGNNVANAGVVGFKGASAQFSDVFASSLGGSGASQILESSSLVNSLLYMVQLCNGQHITVNRDVVHLHQKLRNVTVTTSPATFRAAHKA